MSDDNSTKEIQLTVQLDAGHSVFFRQLRDAGYDVEAIAEAAAQEPVDRAIYMTFMQSKYGDSNE